MSNKTIQIKRTSTELSDPLKLQPGEFALARRKLYIGPKTDSNAIGSETGVSPMRILNEDDYGSLLEIAQGKTTAYVVAEKPSNLTSGTYTNTATGKTFTLSSLKIGDYVLVEATDTPDYFWNGSTLVPIEIDKSLLNGYATESWVRANYSTTSTIGNIYATKTEAQGYVNSFITNTYNSDITSKVDKSSLSTFTTSALKTYSPVASDMVITKQPIRGSIVPTAKPTGTASYSLFTEEYSSALQQVAHKTSLNLTTTVTFEDVFENPTETFPLTTLEQGSGFAASMLDSTIGNQNKAVSIPAFFALHLSLLGTAAKLKTEIETVNNTASQAHNDINNINNELYNTGGFMERLGSVEGAVDSLRDNVDTLIDTIDCGLWA